MTILNDAEIVRLMREINVALGFKALQRLSDLPWETLNAFEDLMKAGAIGLHKDGFIGFCSELPDGTWTNEGMRASPVATVQGTITFDGEMMDDFADTATVESHLNEEEAAEFIRNYAETHRYKPRYGGVDRAMVHIGPMNEDGTYPAIWLAFA